MFDSIKKRLQEIAGAPAKTKRRAAPRIETKLRADATTRRGNVPSYGKMGNVPIRAEVRADGIAVSGPDWVIEKAKQKGQISQWDEILTEEASAVLGKKA